MRNQEPSIFQPMFTFEAPSFKQNKLVQKTVPSIEVDGTTNTVKCKDSDTQVAIVRAHHPLQTNTVIAFFQVQILKCNPSHTNDCSINIGMTTKDGNPRAHVGKYTNSLGYYQGDIFLNKKKIGSAAHVGRKDRIGCGINCSNMSFFFTKNKEILAKDLSLPEGNKWNQFYPAIALQYNDETVKCYFEKKDFLFDIASFAQQIQAQVKEEIFNEDSDNEEIPSSEIYSLISEYMLFNGYSKTLQMMKNKKKEIQFQPVNKLTKNLYGSKIPINLDEEKLQSVKENQYLLENIEAKSGNSNEQMKEQENEDKNRERSRSRQRQRIMSDVHPEMLFESNFLVQGMNEPKRKNTESNPLDLLTDYNKLRKQSNISNVSIIDEDSINDHKVQRKIQGKPIHQTYQEKEQLLFQQSLTLNERFLLNERLEIISFIKQMQIELAQKIIVSKIPKLYEFEPQLETQMKVHIFFRKVIQEGSTSAVQYIQGQEKFVKNCDSTFPSYDPETGNIERVHMKKIFCAILAKQKKSQKRFLQKQQFEYFAQYVNTLIMKHMGVMGNSRLGAILEHSTIALRKLKDFKGMTCGIDLMN